MTKSDWWYSATPDQKLAQIDGGIECGMTAAQVAMVSGTSGNTALHFAGDHGRSFVARKPSGSKRRFFGVQRQRAAYSNGDAVDFWQEPTPTNTAEVEEIRF